jgi:hypothetical protein
MTLIARIGSALLFLAVILPIVSAHGGGGGGDGPWNGGNDRNDRNDRDKSCGKNEFLYDLYCLVDFYD